MQNSPAYVPGFQLQGPTGRINRPIGWITPNRSSVFAAQIVVDASLSTSATNSRPSRIRR